MSKAKAAAQFFKQWGQWCPADAIQEDDLRVFPEVWIGLDGVVIDSAPGVDFFGDAVLYKVGKKDAGRVLDGHEWSEVPA